MQLPLILKNDIHSLFIIFSNLVSAITWGILANSIANFEDRLFVLSAGFFLTIVILFILNRSRVFLHNKNWDVLRHTFLWSLSFCGTYFLFFYFREQLKLSHLMIAKSLAPFLSVYFFRLDSVKVNHVKQLLCILLLCLIAFVEAQNFSLSNGTTLLLLGVMVLLFINSTTQTRLVAKKNNLMMSTFLFSIFNFVFLFFGVFLIGGVEGPVSRLPDLFGFIFLCFASILVIQFLLLKGTSKSHDFQFVLFANSSVPISLVLDKLAFGHEVNNLSYFLAFSYLIIIAIDHLGFRRWNKQV